MAPDIIEEDLRGCNTLGLPARARVLRIGEAADARVLSELADAGQEVFVLGGGSNVVMRERPRHLVARVGLRGVRLLREDGEAWVVEAAAGEPWHGFVDHCLRRGWPGLENLALIPGTVGAAPVQNIGAYGLELDRRLEGVVAWDVRAARRVELAPGDCGFAYRDSMFKRAGAGRWLILAVRFRLPKAWRPVLDYPDLRAHPALAAGAATPRAVFEAVCEIRRRKLPDPAVLGNAGSFFKNPVVPAAMAEALRARFPGLPAYAQPGGAIMQAAGTVTQPSSMVTQPGSTVTQPDSAVTQAVRTITQPGGTVPQPSSAVTQPGGVVKLAAGWLIERAGWKGRRLGPVGMHERQALVLVNHGGASAEDVLQLAEAVREDVRARFGVDLEREPVLLD